MTSERSRIPCLSAAAAEGTGKKQQEGRAMATLDRKVPSPEAFLGKPWSSWIDAAKLHCSDNVDLEEAGKEGGKSREVMRLNKEDMHLFGHYPAHDDFYLVVCSACNQVVKPQVFQSHCGRKQDSRRDASVSWSTAERTQALEQRQVGGWAARKMCQLLRDRGEEQAPEGETPQSPEARTSSPGLWIV
ncbi:ataxin-7-like protein 1 isoform X14 [Fukomys damarensis]|uniref:ataxin-7-like protein 1 isoform X14 n=1 Tax=Fukomys damarensis TaxID=885580 RepID=UPI00053F89C4|nr:ataxin-7-like protein 1 isoform X14 [Fukomys damarensis]